jgi:hypothetical protein
MLRKGWTEINRYKMCGTYKLCNRWVRDAVKAGRKESLLTFTKLCPISDPLILIDP